MWLGRPDGHIARDVPGYRQMMPYFMTTKSSSNVYSSFKVDMEKAVELVEKRRAAGEGTAITLTHIFLCACVRTLAQHPELNRFVSGRRIYDRDGIVFSFTAKKAFDLKAPVIVIKMRFEPDESLAEVARRVTARLAQGRSSRVGESFEDKETKVLLKLPRELVRLVVGLQAWLDHFNLLPADLIEKDLFYASAFIANLGSIGLDAAYHHLYEYGNIPLFITIGKVQPVPVYDDRGRVVMRPMTELKLTMDERITDGFYAARALTYFKQLVENPELML
jgi:hypothetical protein